MRLYTAEDAAQFLERNIEVAARSGSLVEFKSRSGNSITFEIQGWVFQATIQEVEPGD